MKALLLTAALTFAAGLAAGENDLRNRMQPYLTDSVTIGHADSEKQHGMAEKNSLTIKGRDGRTARLAARGGEFSYTLAVDDATRPQRLHVRYDGNELPARNEKLLFDVVADGRTLFVQGLNRNQPAGFVDEFYALPSDLLKGKKSVRITFRPHDSQASVGGIYQLDVVREKTRFADFANLSLYRGWSKDHTVTIPGEITYTEPDGPQCGAGGQFVHDDVINLMNYYGLEIEAELKNATSADLELVASQPQSFFNHNLPTQGSYRFHQVVDKP